MSKEYIYKGKVSEPMIVTGYRQTFAGREFIDIPFPKGSFVTEVSYDPRTQYRLVKYESELFWISRYWLRQI